MFRKLPRPNGRHKWAGHFPGDPRYVAGGIFTAPADDIACLGRKVFLSTAVLDCIIHLSLSPTHNDSLLKKPSLP